MKTLYTESERCFGTFFWGLTISRCSEQEFQLWWNKNKCIEYNVYYYILAQYVWTINFKN